MGAEAVQDLLKEIDLDQLSAELTAEVEKSSGQKKVRILKRLEVVEAFRVFPGNRPGGMVADAARAAARPAPMVQRRRRFATSDRNDLYRRVINRNNRLQVACWSWALWTSSSRNEKRMLQEAAISSSTMAAVAVLSLAPTTAH